MTQLQAKDIKTIIRKQLKKTISKLEPSEQETEKDNCKRGIN